MTAFSGEGSRIRLEVKRVWQVSCFIMVNSPKKQQIASPAKKEVTYGNQRGWEIQHGHKGEDLDQAGDLLRLGKDECHGFLLSLCCS